MLQSILSILLHLTEVKWLTSGRRSRYNQIRKLCHFFSYFMSFFQILWPDGIFITKHPSRRRPTPAPSPNDDRSQRMSAVNAESLLTDEQRREAARRAEFVHELIIRKGKFSLVFLRIKAERRTPQRYWNHMVCWVNVDFFTSTYEQAPLCHAEKAPAALVGLIGRKEYEQCAEDVYYFLQVSWPNQPLYWCMNIAPNVVIFFFLVAAESWLLGRSRRFAWSSWLSSFLNFFSWQHSPNWMTSLNSSMKTRIRLR